MRGVVSTLAEPAEVAAGPRMRRMSSPGAVLAVATLGTFMAFVDATIVNIAIPDIHQEFSGSSLTSVSWVLNAYNIIFAAFLVAGGQLADLLGRRRIFGLSLILFTLASAACAAAPTLGLLIAARLLQAAGAAALVPSSLAIVLEAHPGARRTHAVSLWAAIAALAAGVGPALGGVLITASSWRLVFLVNIPVGIVAYLLASRVLVESRAPGRRRVPDLVGGAVLALAIACLVLAIVKGQEWGWGSARTVAAFAVAVLLGVYFVLRSSRQRVPVVDLTLMRIRSFSLSNGVTVVMASGFYGYTLCNVLFLTTIWKYSILKAGLSMTPGPLVAIAVAAPASRAVGRWGHRAVAVPGALIWAAGVAFFATQLGLAPDFVGAWLPGMVILGVGAGLTFPTLSGAAVESVPGPRFAVATSLNAVARQIGAALGVAVLIAIVGNGAAPQIPKGLPAGIIAALEHSALEGALGRFQNGWFYACGCFVFGALACLALTVTGPAEEAEDSGAELEIGLAPAGPALVPELPSLAESDGVHAVVEPEPLAEFLRNAPVFADLPRAMLERVAALAESVTLPRAEWLFREGEPADAVYLVRVGHLEVLRSVESDTDSTHEAINTLTRGAVLGELALLSSSTRSASVRALRDTELLRIDKRHFDELLRSEPELALSLTRVLSSQLQASRAIPVSRRARPVTVALRAAGPGVPLLDIADELSRALCAWGKVAVLYPHDGSGNGVAPGSRAEAAARYGPLIESCELEHEQVIMVCGSSEEPSGWDEFCISRADRILAVVSGPAGGAQDDGAVGHGRWAAGLSGADLVGYAVSEGAGDLQGWIDLLHPASIHVLSAGPRMRGDVQRMARRLAGRSLGVVLSGGGARAFAHLGALEVLMAAGMTVDRVGGVSMGAFIGAQLAMGRDVSAIDACCYEEWVRRNPINDYTIPRAGLIRGNKARAMLERVFGDSRTEELPRSFYCASVNLRRSGLVISRDGLLFEAVGASISLPLIAPPLRHADALLIDGSLLDNLPLEPMAASGEGPVLAMDIKGGDERPAGGERTRDQAPRRLPSLPETLARIALLSSANTDAAAQRYADMTISVRVSGVGLLEFHQIDHAREAGRRAAIEALAGDPPAWLTGAAAPAADLTGRRTVVRI